MNSKVRGKRLLFLGGAVQCCKVVEAAKKLGVYTVVTDINASVPMRRIADEILPFSVKDVDGIANWCNHNHIDGVLNLCIDAAQNTQAQLCSMFSFPSYGDCKQVFALSNKEAFNQICKENGIDTIPKYDESDLQKNEIEYPVLVKPAESSGSRGLCICYSKDDLIQAIRNAKIISNNGKAVIEKYMGSFPDFTMSYFIINGEPYLYCTHDRYLGRKEDGLDRQCICQYGPSKYLGFYLKNIDEKFKKMIRSLALQNAPVFFQGFIDGDKLRVYDPGIRFPGTEYETAFLRATNIDLMKIIVEYALGESISHYAKLFENSYLLNGMRTASLLFDCRPGRIGEFYGLDEIRKIPEVARISQKAFIDDVIPSTGDVKQRVCEITIISENDSYKMYEIIKKIQSLIAVIDTEGNNMLVSPFDAQHVFDY